MSQTEYSTTSFMHSISIAKGNSEFKLNNSWQALRGSTAMRGCGTGNPVFAVKYL